MGFELFNCLTKLTHSYRINAPSGYANFNLGADCGIEKWKFNADVMVKITVEFP